MAGERIVLAELDFDVDKLIATTAETKKALLATREEMKKLRQENKEGTPEYARLDAQLRLQTRSYNQLQGVIRNQIDLSGTFLNRTEAITAALAAQIATTDDASANTSQLIAIRRTLNSNLDDEAELIARINERIDQNTEYVRQNGSAIEQQRMNIGNYKADIMEALDAINPLNGGLTGFIARSREAGGVGPLLTQSFTAMTTGIWGMVKAGLAFIATPLGMFLAALAATVAIVVGAFKFMQASMNSTEEGSQKLAKVMATVKGVFEGFWKLIKPLGEWLGKVFIGYLEFVGNALDKLTDALAETLDFLGFDDAAESIRGMKEEIKASAKAAADLAKAEGDLDKAQRKSKITQLEYQKQAEKLRQQRDDESKSISERIRLNNELGEVLKKQLKDELSIAEQALKVANLRIKAEGATKENLDAQAEALTEIADIHERITGQESEQLANLNSLRKEAADAEKERQEKAAAARKKALEDYAEKLDLEIELFRQANEGKNTTLDEQIAYAEQIRDKQLAIAKAEYNASEKTSNDKLALQIRENEIRQEYIDAQVAAVVTAAKKEYDAVVAANKSKLDNNKFLTDEMVAQEKQRLDTIAEAEKLNLETQLKNKVLSEEQYRAEVSRIDADNKANNDALEKQRTEAENARRLADIDNRRAAEQLTFEEDLALQLERLDIERQQELAAAEKTGADLKAINEKYNALEIKAQDEVLKQKLSAYQSTLGEISDLLGENTALGKLTAIAEATINTYLAATAALASGSKINPVYGVVSAAAAIATGLKSVQKITSTKTPKAEKGALFSIGGKRHSSGGTLFTGADGTRFEAEQGELIGVMNRNAARHFMAFNNAFPAGGVSTPSYFAGGGTISPGAGSVQINIDELALKIGAATAAANASLPSPVVSVSEIVDTNAKMVKTQEFTTH